MSEDIKINNINKYIKRINNMLDVAEDNSLDHDDAIDCITYASNINENWKSIVETMLNDPTYKPDLSELKEINY